MKVEPQPACCIPASKVAPGEWAYKVSFENRTPDTIDELIVFYRLKDGQDSIRFQTMQTLLPGARHVFRFGIARQLKSYVVGVFIGKQLVAELSPEVDADTRHYAHAWVMVPKAAGAEA